MTRTASGRDVILDYLRAYGPAAVPELRAVTGLADGTVRKLLDRLRGECLVSPTGGRPKRYYRHAATCVAEDRYAGRCQCATLPAGGWDPDGVDETPAQPGDSVYRCAMCKHGRRLTVWAQATVLGDLQADGDLGPFLWDEVHTIHEDSIQCLRHGDGHAEKSIGGRWHRPVNCPCCGGSGTIPGEAGYRDQACPERAFPDPDAGGRPSHSVWWPSGEPGPWTAPDPGGHDYPPTPRGGPQQRCLRCGAQRGDPVSGGDRPCTGEKPDWLARHEAHQATIRSRLGSPAPEGRSPASPAR